MRGRWKSCGGILLFDGRSMQLRRGAWGVGDYVREKSGCTGQVFDWLGRRNQRHAFRRQEMPGHDVLVSCVGSSWFNATGQLRGISTQDRKDFVLCEAVAPVCSCLSERLLPEPVKGRASIFAYEDCGPPHDELRSSS
jgi:hypothetical protein